MQDEAMYHYQLSNKTKKKNITSRIDNNESRVTYCNFIDIIRKTGNVAF